MSKGSQITGRLVHFDILALRVGKEVSLASEFLTMVCSALTVILKQGPIELFWQLLIFSFFTSLSRRTSLL